MCSPLQIPLPYSGESPFFRPMDELAHHCKTNHRKRKPDQEEHTDAPRQQARLVDTDTAWSPQVSSPLAASTRLRTAKRPRIDTANLATKTDNSGATMFSPIRTPNDIEDIGIIVTTSDPGPSSGSLLRERPAVAASFSPPPIIRKPTPPRPQCDLSSPHIPPMTPLINRQTLRELDLDVIIRNPVLRHDLLFDAGLQFRPRRKRDLSEKYWAAVWEEVRTGCTCVTLDAHGKLHATVCVCARCPQLPEEPLANPMVLMVSNPASGTGVYTVRMPSRIPALLAEFLEVMLFVIQPLTNTNVYSNPNDVKDQAREHLAHAAHLREIFDPVLIYQELRHGVFDPSGLFQHIGETLKHHCAPMRDRAVEDLVRFAQQPGVEAVKAFRTCLELLELMKLDIANHQLTQLRPWLLRNTGTFEIKAFKMRFGSEPSLHHTREWLHSTHDALMAREDTTYLPYSSSSPPTPTTYKDMTRNQQTYVSALRGIVDIVYDQWLLGVSSSGSRNSPPQTPLTASTPTASSANSSSSPTSPTVARPETLYLDKTRLSNLASEASDATAMYMFMLLFRQLAFVDLQGVGGSRGLSRVDEMDVVRLKGELMDIGMGIGVPGAGTGKMGACFLPPPDVAGKEGRSEKESKEIELRRSARLDLVLQVVRRASELRSRRFTTSSTWTTPDLDQRLLSIATRWADTNMQPGSTLAVLLHNRMKEVLFDLVVSLAWPGKEAVGTKTSISSNSNSMPSTPTSAPNLTKTGRGAIFISSPVRTHPGSSLPFASSSSSSSSEMQTTHPVLHAATTTSALPPMHLTIDLWSCTRTLHTAEATTTNYQAGMEGVMEDARMLAEKIARLSLIHLNTYLGLYESEGFLEGRWMGFANGEVGTGMDET